MRAFRRVCARAAVLAIVVLLLIKLYIPSLSHQPSFRFSQPSCPKTITFLSFGITPYVEQLHRIALRYTVTHSETKLVMISANGDWNVISDPLRPDIVITCADLGSPYSSYSQILQQSDITVLLVSPNTPSSSLMDLMKLDGMDPTKSLNDIDANAVYISRLISARIKVVLLEDRWDESLVVLQDQLCWGAEDIIYPATDLMMRHIVKEHEGDVLTKTVHASASTSLDSLLGLVGDAATKTAELQVSVFRRQIACKSPTMRKDSGCQIFSASNEELIAQLSRGNPRNMLTGS